MTFMVHPIPPSAPRLRLPESLQVKLGDFRRRLWTIKLLEAFGGAVSGILFAFIIVFVLDRLIDTPRPARLAILLSAAVSCGTVPWVIHRWIWRRRRLDQLARLLQRRDPGLGDQLLGIIELVQNEAEQARSHELCQAAISQVSADTESRDLRVAIPQSRHRLWLCLAGWGVAVTAALMVLFPGAAGNAWIRYLSPWRTVPRYTFTQLDSLPERCVVPHGEPFAMTLRLTESSPWRPDNARLTVGEQPELLARRAENWYHFDCPPQIAPTVMTIRVGDLAQVISVLPRPRPELAAAFASVALPDYLGRPEVLHKDVRGGLLSAVKGSRAQVTATAGRPLSAAVIDGRPIRPAGASIVSPWRDLSQNETVTVEWTDEFGLTGQSPYRLSIDTRDDEAPAIVCEDLPRQRVVLDSEVLQFKVRGLDDFGVKAVGLEWKGADPTLGSQRAVGERLLGAGGHAQEELALTGTFSAKRLDIEPQPLELRLYVEDYFPGRPRVYSPTYLLYVLTPEQHAVRITEQLGKWHRQSLEVRDREMQLYEANRQLRDLNPSQLNEPETRRRLETQAAAERANGRRLNSLVGVGEELVKQAARNDEFGVAQLEPWAEMLQLLQEISASRMPSVADLLRDAALSPAPADTRESATAGEPAEAAPPAGSNRGPPAGGTGKAPQEEAEREKLPPVPTIADVESTQQPLDPTEAGEAQQPNSPSPPRLGLPTTTLLGGAKSDLSLPGEKVSQAVQEQKELLTEFEKISDELNMVLANLEGSTLVKRLKAASRVEYKLADGIGGQLSDTFGRRQTGGRPQGSQVHQEMRERLVTQQRDTGQVVSYIMDDIQAYYERRRMVKFKSILEEMRQQDVLGSLRELADEMQVESGLAMAQCEYWSDTLDRWAEDLVDPAAGGTGPRAKSSGSLPPSLILEVLRILEGETSLREETRVVQQARPAVTDDQHLLAARQLAATQEDLRRRTEQVVDQIGELPDPEANFGNDIQLLDAVSHVMTEAHLILAARETGDPAIAAETDAIELLLQSQRVNPQGSGGGGSANPGGGAQGTTSDSALALLGSGTNRNEQREESATTQATGTFGITLPEEYRAGLDQYFNQLENK
jgi:hypothetical protein